MSKIEISEIFEKGDVVRFESEFNPNINSSYFFEYVHLEKGTLAQVANIEYRTARNRLSDTITVILVLSILYEGIPLYFEFNYSEHYHVISKTPAIQVLYGKG